jgi:hypothetical protein
VLDDDEEDEEDNDDDDRDDDDLPLDVHATAPLGTCRLTLPEASSTTETPFACSHSLLSRLMVSPPPARDMASASPPACCSILLAGFTIASQLSTQRSPTRTDKRWPEGNAKEPSSVLSFPINPGEEEVAAED